MEAYNPQVEVVEYRGLRLVIRQTPLDWLVFIILSGGQREFVAGADRESALARATAWVDGNMPSNAEDLITTRAMQP
jgi:hypothetical protein